MISIHTTPDTQEKLSILSTDAQYDLACACGTNDKDRRRRAADDRWLYPVTLPNGGHTVLFKTLLSNACVNDCKYCPLRADGNTRRCTLETEEVVRTFLSYLRAGKVFGLFLSSGVVGTPDQSMDRLLAIARILRRREHFRGYMHLKVLPGASDAALQEALSLSSAVSINIETPGEKHFKLVSSRKNYLADVIGPIRRLSEWTARGSRFHHVKLTTQFVVGASTETDREIVKYSWGLYRRLDFDRVYFSAYQRGLGAPDLPGEQASISNDALLTREHRLYQTDFLIRKYGFKFEEIPFGNNSNLSLDTDPKTSWAEQHPDFFPLNVNRADKFELLRVPGLGPTMVNRILAARSEGSILHSLDKLVSRRSSLLQKAASYVTF